VSKFIKCAITVIGVIALNSCDLFLSPRMGKVIQTWVTTNNTFKIRVNRHAEENGGFVGGAYYVFQAAKQDSDNWIEIMVVRHDDPIDIPRQQVRFVNDQIGYAFMKYKFAVTIDEGITWSVWDAVNNLQDWKLTRASISDVHIEPNGDGAMKLVSFTDRSPPNLFTKEYGKTWFVK
jgi:hypothetical protein